MKANSAIQKGKELENFIVDRLRLSGLDTRAYRQKGSGNGLNKGDVWNDLGLSFEAKNQKSSKIKEWFKEAKKDSQGSTVPVVVWHPNNVPLEESFVVIDWGFFEELLQHRKQPNSQAPDREFKYKLNRLVQAAKDLIKEL